MMDQKIYDLFAKASQIARFWNPEEKAKRDDLLEKLVDQKHFTEVDKWIREWVKTLEPDQLDEIERLAVEKASLLFGSITELSPLHPYDRQASLRLVCLERDNFEALFELLAQVGRGKDLKEKLNDVDQTVNAQESDLNINFDIMDDEIPDHRLAAVRRINPSAWWARIAVAHEIVEVVKRMRPDPIVIPEVPSFVSFTGGKPVPEWLEKLATKAAQGEMPYDRVLAVSLICRFAEADSEKELKRRGRLFWSQLNHFTKEMVIRQSLNTIDKLLEEMKEINKLLRKVPPFPVEQVIAWIYQRDDLECIRQLVQQSEEGQLLVNALVEYDDIVSMVSETNLSEQFELWYLKSEENKKLVDERRFRAFSREEDIWWDYLDWGQIDWWENGGCNDNWFINGLRDMKKGKGPKW